MIITGIKEEEEPEKLLDSHDEELKDGDNPHFRKFGRGGASNRGCHRGGRGRAFR